MARDEQNKKYTATTTAQKKNLIMQIIFPISLFHMTRSLSRNPVKRASHRISFAVRYANIRTNGFSRLVSSPFLSPLLMCAGTSHIPFCFEKTAWSLADISFIIFYSIHYCLLIHFHASSSLPNRLSA